MANKKYIIIGVTIPLFIVILIFVIPKLFFSEDLNKNKASREHFIDEIKKDYKKYKETDIAGLLDSDKEEFKEKEEEMTSILGEEDIADINNKDNKTLINALSEMIRILNDAQSSPRDNKSRQKVDKQLKLCLGIKSALDLLLKSISS